MKKLSIIKKMTNAITVIGCCLLVIGMGACSDMLETKSELVEFEKDNTLNHPTDSVYSVLGIVNRMQLIADRLVLLGEARGDLVTPTAGASSDLKRLAAFDLKQSNKYNRVSDFYAVINNCNYYLAHVDTALQRRGRKLFEYEYAAVKAYRAWTYLELVKNYGRVPLVTEPLMTELEAAAAATAAPQGIQDICNFFIADLTPYAFTEQPNFGAVNGYDSQLFFIPMRALLGDLCLWAGRYEEAARWYNSYLNDKEHPVMMNYASRVSWPSATVFQRPFDGYSVRSRGGSMGEVRSFIPMEERVFDGTVSDLPNIFSSTSQNNYFFQLTPSAAMRRISADQIYCKEYTTETTTDTIYVPRTGMSDDLFVGDLRLYSNYSLYSLGQQDPYSEYSSLMQSITKHWPDCVPTYRTTMVYLRYAEALNRARLPQSAMCLLKYGMCAENMQAYVDSLEREQAKELTTFDETLFTHETTVGIHSRGSGDSECNAFYVLPQPDHQLASRQDTIDYQIPLVEDMIINEMALEGSFEGYRFYDLMRVALRRGDPSYLATPIARRLGETDETLRTLLMDTSNWFLPLR